jgi:hypothetical protein
MINSLPFVGWFLSFFFNVSLAIPFWLCWTVFSIGTRYFWWAPVPYQSISFWNCVGLFVCISILKGVLVPSFASVTQTNNKGRGHE